jgi:hypothetical protein
MTVLYWKCKGLKYEQIGARLTYGVDWVTLTMGGVYTKLGFSKEMHWTKRWEILKTEVCPLVPKNLDDWQPVIEITEGSREEIREEPVVNPEIKALVLYDEKMIEAEKEKSLIPPKPKETIVIRDLTKGQKTFRRFVFALLAAVIISFLGIVVYNLGRGATPAPQIIIITTTPIPTSTETPTPLATVTPLPTITFTPEPTFTPLPTATEFIPPEDGILSEDNFESGDLSAWTQVNGKWLVSNGQLTAFGDDNDSYKWIALKRPEWKNYILSLTVYQPHQGAASQADVLIAVRNNGSQIKYIGVPVDNFGNVYWAFIGSDMFDNDVIGGNKFEFGFESGSTMKLEMQGDTYVLDVNGRELQRITMSGYDSGGISLGSDCDKGDDCARFDNIKVTYLP